MDFRRRPDAARAGLAQGLAYAADVKPYWSRGNEPGAGAGRRRAGGHRLGERPDRGPGPGRRRSGRGRLHIQGTSAGAFVGVRLAMGEACATLADPILADATSMVRDVARSTRKPPDLTKLMRMMAQGARGQARSRRSRARRDRRAGARRARP